MKGFRSSKQRDLFRAALAAGWTWKHAGTDHIVIISPEGLRVTLSTTANDKGREYKNNRAAARRAGLDV